MSAVRRRNILRRMGERDACWSKRARYNLSRSFATTNGRRSAANVAPAAAPAATSNASRLLRIAALLWCNLCKLPVAAHSCCSVSRPIRALDKRFYSCSAQRCTLPAVVAVFAQLASCKALGSCCVRVGQQFCELLHPSANGVPQQESLRPVHTAEASRSRGVHHAPLCSSL